MRIKRGDRVVIITGKDKGAEGKVLLVDRKRQRVIVEGRNMVTRHTKQNAQNPQGGLVKKESPIHVSNVALYDVVSNKAERVGFKVVDGKKVRVYKSSGRVVGAK